MHRLTASTLGLVKWYSLLYRNQGKLLFAPVPLDCGEQIVVITGGTFSRLSISELPLFMFSVVGASGIGELIANTLAVRNVTVVVLDVNPIVTENCMEYSISPLNDGLTGVC